MGRYVENTNKQVVFFMIPIPKFILKKCLRPIQYFKFKAISLANKNPLEKLYFDLQIFNSYLSNNFLIWHHQFWLAIFQFKYLKQPFHLTFTMQYLDISLLILNSEQKHIIYLQIFDSNISNNLWFDIINEICQWILHYSLWTKTLKIKCNFYIKQLFQKQISMEFL